MASLCCAISQLAALTGMLMMMVSSAYALQYTVGGPGGWVVGDDMQNWASQYTFYVGDELYFKYVYGKSSVLLVNEEDYKDCNTNNGVESDGGLGDMVMTLLSPQIYYFISGHGDQCTEGLRIEVHVLDKSAGTGTGTGTGAGAGSGANQPGLTNPNPSTSGTGTSIPTDPVILTPPRSINTPYSTARPNSSTLLSSTSMLFSLTLALAFTYLLTH